MALFRRKASDVSVQDRIDPPPPTPAPVFEPGVPGRCPMCDGFGYIDHIDMINRVQSQHCKTCGHSWNFRFDEDHQLIDLTDERADDERTGSAASRHHEH